MGSLLTEVGLALCLLGPSGHQKRDGRLSPRSSFKPANIQVKTLTADWTQEGASKAVTRWLRLGTRYDAPVNLVAAQNDEMAIGARQALRQDVPKRERESWMNLPYLVSLCCPDTGTEGIRQGLLTASIMNPSTAGVSLEMLVLPIQTHTQPPQRTVLSPASCPEIEKLSAKPAPRSS